MRNHEVTSRKPLLKEDGSLREPGWSRRPVQIYDRKAIKAPKYRIKEWDYYIVLSEKFGAAFTVSDLGYIGLNSVTFFDFEIEKESWLGHFTIHFVILGIGIYIGILYKETEELKEIMELAQKKD